MPSMRALGGDVALGAKAFLRAGMEAVPQPLLPQCPPDCFLPKFPRALAFFQSTFTVAVRIEFLFWCCWHRVFWLSHGRTCTRILTQGAPLQYVPIHLLTFQKHQAVSRSSHTGLFSAFQHSEASVISLGSFWGAFKRNTLRKLDEAALIHHSSNIQRPSFGPSFVLVGVS